MIIDDNPNNMIIDSDPTSVASDANNGGESEYGDSSSPMAPETHYTVSAAVSPGREVPPRESVTSESEGELLAEEKPCEVKAIAKPLQKMKLSENEDGEKPYRIPKKSKKPCPYIDDEAEVKIARSAEALYPRQMRKQPQYTGKIFTFKDDWIAHRQNLIDHFQKNEGMTEVQKYHLIKDSMDQEMKSHVDVLRIGNILPKSGEIFALLDTIFTPTGKKGISWDLKLGSLRQGKHETINAFAARVLDTLNAFRNNVDVTDPKNRQLHEHVKRNAFVTLTSNCLPDYSRELEKIQAKWLNGELRQPFHCEFMSTWKACVDMGNEEMSMKKAGPSGNSKQTRKCRYGLGCKKQETCPFLHHSDPESENRPSGSNSNGKRKANNEDLTQQAKRQSAMKTCEKCGPNRSHASDKCWNLHPELRPNGNSRKPFNNNK
jgi:hypothetical protein